MMGVEVSDNLGEARLNGHAAADSANLSRISDAVRKPWHKTAIGWFSFVAMLAAIFGALVGVYGTFYK